VIGWTGVVSMWCASSLLDGLCGAVFLGLRPSPALRSRGSSTPFGVRWQSQLVYRVKCEGRSDGSGRCGCPRHVSPRRLPSDTRDDLKAWERGRESHLPASRRSSGRGKQTGQFPGNARAHLPPLRVFRCRGGW